MPEAKFTNPMLIPDLLKTVGPKNELLLNSIRIGGPVWKSIPYTHEKAILTVYLGINETQASHESFTKEFPGHLANIFSWICSLQKGQFPVSSRIKGRKSGPLFLEEADKKDLEIQIKRLRSDTFLRDFQNLADLMVILRNWVNHLVLEEVLVSDFDEFNSSHNVLA